MPNFLIIGAAKAGTTALYHYLHQHPQIYLSPRKEPRFFAYEGENLNFCGPYDHVEASRDAIVTDINIYQSLFQGVSTEKAIGEASTLYHYSLKAPERIQHYIPDAKLIAILRNPVDRAYSGFLHFVRDDLEPLTDFAQALQEEEVRIRNNWLPGYHYKEMGFYYTQLKRYYARFDHSRIKIYLYEDFKTGPLSVLRNIFRFLRVDEEFVPDISIRHNVSGIPRNKMLYRYFLRGRNPIKAILKPFIPTKLRRRIKTNLINVRKTSAAHRIALKTCSLLGLP
ncbi:sulfotransferase [Thermodesulfobacteriota bacterium]